MDLYEVMIKKIFDMNKEIDILDAKEYEESGYGKMEPQKRDYNEDMSAIYFETANYDKALEMAKSIKILKRKIHSYMQYSKDFLIQNLIILCLSKHAIKYAIELNNQNFKFYGLITYIRSDERSK